MASCTQQICVRYTESSICVKKITTLSRHVFHSSKIHEIDSPFESTAMIHQIFQRIATSDARSSSECLDMLTTRDEISNDSLEV